MTARTWLFQTLLLSPFLGPLVGNRIFPKKDMTSSVEEYPYMVYKLGYKANEDLAEDQNVNRQYVQIFVHDFSDMDTGDYVKIDEVIKALKDTLHLNTGPSDGVILCRFLETSQDLDDLTLGTVMKYARFQIIEKED